MVTTHEAGVGTWDRRIQGVEGRKGTARSREEQGREPGESRKGRRMEGRHVS